jgi:hypothetical protein
MKGNKRSRMKNCLSSLTPSFGLTRGSFNPVKPLEEEMDDAQQKGDIERLAKHADICKMHTYRDALKCRAATILFPGTKGVFYRTDGQGEENVYYFEAFRDIVQNQCWEGVGALPLVPKRVGNFREVSKMAKPEWSWSEKDIQKALEGFKSYLQSGESKKHIEQHNDRQQRAQELLKDGTTIDRLINEQLAKLLRDTDAFVGT